MRLIVAIGLAAALSLPAATPSRSAEGAAGPQSVAPGRVEGRNRPVAPVLPPSTGSEGPPRAGGAETVLTDLSLTFGHTRVTVPRLEALGTDLTAERLRTLLDPAAPLTLAERLDALTAASLAAPTVIVSDLEGDAGQDGQRLVLTDVAVTDAVAGRIGAVSVGGAKVVARASAGGGELATFGPLRAAEVDLPLAARVAEGHRDDPSEAPTTVLGSLSVDTIALHPEDGTTVALGGMQVVGLRLRPLLKPIAEAVSLLDKSEDALTAEQRHGLASAAVDAVGSVALDHVAWDGLETRSADGTSNFKLGRLTLDGLAPTQLRAWTSDDLALRTSEATILLKHFALHGPDESALVPYLARMLEAGTFETAPNLPPNLPAQDASLAAVGLAIHVPSQDGTGNSADGRWIDATIPVASMISTAGGASGLARAATHVRLDVPLPPAAAVPQTAALHDSGIDAIHGSLDTHVSLDVKSREMRIDPLSISAEKLGSLATSLVLGNLPTTVAANGTVPDPRQMILRRIGVSFTNAGAVGLVLPLMAASANTSVPMLKAGLKTKVELTVSQALGPSPAATRIISAVDAFLDDPRNFTLTVDAPGGLTLGEIEDAPDPKVLLDRVGIEATADR